MDPSSDFKEELSLTEKSDLLVLKSSNIYTSEGRVISGYVVIKDGKIVDICETLPSQISTEDTKILEGYVCCTPILYYFFACCNVVEIGLPQDLLIFTIMVVEVGMPWKNIG